MADLKMFDLTGKKALVTGAAVGIGRGYATALAMAGADVAILDIAEKTGKKTAEQLADQFKVKTTFVRCDVTNPAEITDAVGQVVAKFGRLDIGVNNAGIGILGPDSEYSYADWQKVISINLTGAYLCAQAEAKVFIAQKSGGRLSIRRVCPPEFVIATPLTTPVREGLSR